MWRFHVALLWMLLAGCGDDGAHPARRLGAEVARTSYGIVHVRAEDFGGLGFGLAYAYAQDNICMLADFLLTVRGERSRYFGGDAPPTVGTNGEYSVAIDYLNEHMFDLRNEDSDFFFKAYLDLDALRAGYARASPDARALLRGYVAGYNQYLREYRASLPKACHDAAWVKPITVDDLYLLIAEKAIHASGQVFPRQILAAAQDVDEARTFAAVRPRDWGNLGLGSNGLALGGDVTRNGRGMLLANPHYPWFSTDRFYQVHLTVPGAYDVMGVSLGGLPAVVIGFNRDVAWTHTVTKALHFTTFRLQRDKADRSGRSYLIDGVPQRMTERVVEVQLRQPDGSQRVRRKTFFYTRLGMPIVVPGVPVGPDDIIVLGDPNRDNTRLLDQWLAIGRATSVQALRTTLGSIMGLPWVNTVAADRQGGALYIDASVVPHVTTAQFLSDCMLFGPLLLFDGSRSACHWGSDPGSPAGIFGVAQAPQLLRRDYVANSNDSYWLTNSAHLLTGPEPLGYSPLYGPTAVPQHLRTRLGFVQIDSLLAARHDVDLDDLQDLIFSNRVHAAELVLPDLLAACLGTTDVTLGNACGVLRAWDRKVDLDSRGALLFREFWLKAVALPAIWAVPFDPRDPVHTPRGVAAAAVPSLLTALKETAQRLSALGIAPDARLGDYQVDQRAAYRTEVHGGTGDIDGVYNALHMTGPLTAQGYGSVRWGTSYVQLVAFDDSGPIARGLLPYGQSTDPVSPWYADQLPLYAGKDLPRLPFTEEEIQMDGNFRRDTVSEK
ncbi:penicillin acylase family protein [[Empedobacter] haloabium]|uniref:Penicillin acylase family protein n=1 Tax=[Empedobacter] haloabium TaxID=592317 RepID=A0ABZ1UML4_9BURK